MKNLLLLLLVTMPLIVSVVDEGKFVARASEDEDDIIDDEDDEGVVDEGAYEGDAVVESEDVEEEEDSSSQGSPDADTIIYFTKPAGIGGDLPAGKLVEFLVGFSNNGDKDFVLDAIDASFRYPMDFTYAVQNFTAVPYNRAVKPHQEATVMYSFFPAEAFAGRPLGLTINLAYHDANGEQFIEAVFNQTVNIVEVDEGLDGETFFLYIFLAAFAVLLLLAGHHFLSSFGRRRGGKRSDNNVGSKASDKVDFDWIPKDHLQKSPRQSPRQRKAAKTEGADSE